MYVTIWIDYYSWCKWAILMNWACQLIAKLMLKSIGLHLGLKNRFFPDKWLDDIFYALLRNILAWLLLLIELDTKIFHFYCDVFRQKYVCIFSKWNILNLPVINIVSRRIELLNKLRGNKFQLFLIHFPLQIS